MKPLKYLHIPVGTHIIMYVFLRDREGREVVYIAVVIYFMGRETES